MLRAPDKEDYLYTHEPVSDSATACGIGADYVPDEGKELAMACNCGHDECHPITCPTCKAITTGLAN